MIFSGLSHILQQRNAEAIIAWDADTLYRQNDFLRAVEMLRKTLDLHPENRWLLVHDNTYSFAVGLFALLAAGKQVLLPPNPQPGTLADLTNHADALLGEGDTVLLRLPVDTSLDTHSSSKTVTLPLLDLDLPCITLFTSGSTGEPKAITKSLRCLDAEIRTLESLWGHTLDDKTLGAAVILATVSHQHIYGLLFRLLWPLCAGRPFAAHSHHYPEPLIAEVLRHPRSALVSSPSQLKRFPPAIDLATARPRLVTVFSSGGALPFEAAQDWQVRLGRAPIEILGSTETGGVAWRCQTTADAPWQPLPGVQVAVDAGQNLLVQSQFAGADSPYAMGDRAALEADGHFRLLGRADRIVKIEEKRLSLDDMEQRLASSPWTDEVRVLVLPKPIFSPGTPARLGVVATLSDTGRAVLDTQGKQALTHLLRDHLSQHFERVLLPRKWRFPAQLPVDAQGKTPHAALAALFPDKKNQALLEIIEATADRRQLRITLPADSNLFDGHFPELPILPGVVQFDMAARASAVWYPPSAFRRIDKLKFQEPVVPGDTITLTLQHLGSGQVQFSYTLGDKPLSSGRIVFAP